MVLPRAFAAYFARRHYRSVSLGLACPQLAPCFLLSCSWFKASLDELAAVKDLESIAFPYGSVENAQSERGCCFLARRNCHQALHLEYRCLFFLLPREGAVVWSSAPLPLLCA